MTEPTPTPQAPGAPEPVVPAAPAATPPTVVPTPGDPATGFKSEESKNAVLADLARERDARQALEARLDAFSKALGGPSDPGKPEDLAETVKSLQSKFEASQNEALKLRIAASPGLDAEGKPLPAIPPQFHNLLTETDPEKLKAQAVTVAALIPATTATATSPAFLANPGQGQGGGATTPEAIAAAEYAQYYPSKSK